MATMTTENWWQRLPKSVDRQWLFWLAAAVVIAVIVGALAASGIEFSDMMPFTGEETSS